MDSEPAIEQYIIFSDTVIREQGTGKLSLIGTFDRWNAGSFPFRASPFVATVRVTNLEGKFEKLRLTLRVEEPSSGHVVASIGAEMNATKVFERHDCVELPLKMPPMQFQRAGVYEVVVLVNNEPVGRRKFQVNALNSGTQSTQINPE